MRGGGIDGSVVHVALSHVQTPSPAPLVARCYILDIAALL